MVKEIWREKNAATTLYFAALDTTSQRSFVTGISWSAADVQVSQDGGSFSNSTNAPAEIGASGVYSLALTAAETNGDIYHVRISKSSIIDTLIAVNTQAFGWLLDMVSMLTGKLEHDPQASPPTVKAYDKRDPGTLRLTFSSSVPAGVETRTPL